MNKRLPLGLLAILLIVLLAGIGVAYGLWSETLTISGTVNTGEVDVEFANVEKKEGVAVNGILKIPEPSEKEDAANCSYQILNSGTDREKLQVTTVGAYPSWHCFVEFDIKSTGNVPVHIMKPGAVQTSGPNWQDLKVECGNEAQATQTQAVCSDSAQTNCPPPQPTPPPYWQLHENDTLHCKLTIHFNNAENNVPIRENSTYRFVYEITAYQWNETP